MVLNFGTATESAWQRPDHSVRNGLNTLSKCTGVERVTIAGTTGGRLRRLAVTEPSVLLAPLVLPTHATPPAYDSITNNCSVTDIMDGRNSRGLKGECL